jgi:hypothetical protein
MSSDRKAFTPLCGALVTEDPDHLNVVSQLVLDYQLIKKLAHGRMP